MEYLSKEITGMIPEVGIIPSIIQQGRSFANRKKSYRTHSRTKHPGASILKAPGYKKYRQILMYSEVISLIEMPDRSISAARS